MGEKFDYAEYATNMRLALSDPEQIHADGSINHQYFLVKKGTYYSPEMEMTLTECLARTEINLPFKFAKLPQMVMYLNSRPRN